jgi:Secretion system C-terminal sorting domain
VLTVIALKIYRFFYFYVVFQNKTVSLRLRIVKNLKNNTMRYFFLLLALPLCANAQFSNGFAPVGAVWFNNWVSQTGPGHKEIRVVADSVVGSTTYKKLNIHDVKTAGWGLFDRNYTNYFVIRNDSVWIAGANLQQTDLLYNFAANVGDEMNVPNATPPYRAFAKVDSVKTINFLGQNKRAIYYSKHCTENTMSRQGFVVVQGFGVLDDALLNPIYYGYLCQVVDEYNELFVCYNDPTRSYPQNCVVSTEEKMQNKAQIAVFPNPTNDILKINSSETIKNLKITDVLGKIVLEKTENNTETTIYVENLPKGVYFLRVNDVFTQKIVKN